MWCPLSPVLRAGRSLVGEIRGGGGGVGGSQANNQFVYLKSASNFPAPSMNFIFRLRKAFLWVGGSATFASTINPPPTPWGHEAMPWLRQHVAAVNKVHHSLPELQLHV